MHGQLTGQTRHRANLLRQLVLQVQYLAAGEVPGMFRFKWRDAKVEDLATLQSIYLARAQEEGAASTAVKH